MSASKRSRDDKDEDNDNERKTARVGEVADARHAQRAEARRDAERQSADFISAYVAIMKPYMAARAALGDPNDFGHIGLLHLVLRDLRPLLNSVPEQYGLVSMTPEGASALSEAYWTHAQLAILRNELHNAHLPPGSRVDPVVDDAAGDFGANPNVAQVEEWDDEGDEEEENGGGGGGRRAGAMARRRGGPIRRHRRERRTRAS